MIVYDSENRVRAPNKTPLNYPWHLPHVEHSSIPDASIPASFDWRTHAGAPDLTEVQDQGACGCCWAFASSQSLADRMRIACLGGSSRAPLISVEYTKDCGTAALGARYDQLLGLGTQGTTGTCASGASLSMGCEFLEQYGSPSSKAQPYLAATFEGVDAANCLEPSPPDAKLYTAMKGSVAVVTLGPNGHGEAGQLAMMNASLDAATIKNNVANMQKNIMLYGPLAVTYVVYKDLCTTDFDSASYVDGVYVPDLSSGVDGGHAVTIVGWGVGATQQTPYWIVRNSWGTAWNPLFEEGKAPGYYYHRRGTNSCQIESAAVSLRAGSWAGQQVSGSARNAYERQREEDASYFSFWRELSSNQKIGLVAGLSAGAVLLVAIIIALVVYSKDKGWGWTRANSST